MNKEKMIVGYLEGALKELEDKNEQRKSDNSYQ